MYYTKDKDLREYLEHNLPLHMYTKLIRELIDGRLPNILLCEESYWVTMGKLLKNLKSKEEKEIWE